MANGKNIEVRIAATGGDQAAAEVRKVETAVESVGDSSSTASDGIKELQAQMQASVDRAKAMTEGLDEASESAGELEENVGKISNAQQAQIISGLASNVSKIGAEFKSVAKDVEVFDAELAATLNKAGQGLETLGNGLSSVALGFAAGGPIGGAAAALVVAIQSVGQAWIQSKVAAAEATQEQIAAMGDAADAAREATSEAIERNNALASAEIAAAIGAQNDAIKDQAAAVQEVIKSERELREMRNEALQAVDKTKLAEIDLAEARGEINPSQAKAQRRDVTDAAEDRKDNERRQKAREDAIIAGKDAIAKAEAAAQAAAVAQEAERRRAEAERTAAEKVSTAEKAGSNQDAFLVSNPLYQEAYKEYETARKSGDDTLIQDLGAKLDALKVELVTQALAEAQQALEDLKSKSDNAADASSAAGQSAQAAAEARANAGAKNTTADRTDATVSVLASQRARARELTEQAEARRAFDAAKRREDAQALEARREAARTRLDETAKAAGGRFGADADRGEARGVDPEVVATLRNASSKLADGTNQNEVSQLAQQIESAIGQMSGATASALTGLVATMQAQAEELKALEAQIKDLRNK